MSSHRHNGSTAARSAAEVPSTSDKLLAAARASVLDVGWKRTTLTDVAQRAGVSRMTVYRTYSDMTTLFADLMTREWVQVVADVVDRVDGDQPWADRIAGAVAGIVTALRRNELFRRGVDLDPEWLWPYLLERRGRSQEAALELLVEQLGAAQADGAVRAGSPALLARSVLLAAHGFALSVSTMTDDDVDETSLDAELVEMVRRYLA